MIRHDPESRVWVLGSGYVVRVDERDLLRGVHWGPPLTLEQAVSLVEGPGPQVRPVEDEADGALELAVAGGLRFGQAGVQVRFADGTRELEPVYLGERRTADELVLRFADRHYPIVLEASYAVRGEVVERHLVLRNEGDLDITVVRADSATWVVPRLAAYRLGQLRGQWGAETRLGRTELPYGETVLTSRRGVTSHQANPWVTIDDGTAGEEHGAVYSCALAWSGTWRLTVQRLPTEQVSVSAGFGHDPATWRLPPGGTLTTPVCAGLYTEGGFGAASRAWHRYALQHVVPHPEEPRPVLYNSWEVTEFDLGLDGQLRLAELAATLGVELYVMDDGWFGARTHDAAGLGDWWPNPARFPGGLAPLIDHVHGLGMKFGLWVEPEMVNPDSDLYRRHPDWVLHQPHRTRTEHRHQLVLNLGRPEVAEWLHGTLAGLLEDNAIDFLKWDMNRPFTEAGPGTDERLWIDHAQNLYDVIDRLRAAHPGVRIESCSSGGGRVDFGILRRTDQVWTSDNTDALDRLDIQEGFSQVYPARVMGAWVTDSPNPYTGREIPLDFRFHAAMAGQLGIGGSLTEWSPAELSRARELVGLYKQLRPVIQRGALYRLRPMEPSTRAVQYVHEAESVVLVYRPARRFGDEAAPIPLRGLEPSARYEDQATGKIHHGAVLLARGLHPELARGDYASALIHLVRRG